MKLLVVICDDTTENRLLLDGITGVVKQLSSAEDLGRVAIDSYKHCPASNPAVVTHMVGEAILAEIRRQDGTTARTTPPAGSRSTPK
jgi:hypothetical protein